MFALEVSRLARSSADWHRLLELCALADVVIVDEQTVYAPRDHNDRLLLGLKGTMSEAEIYWMRLRLDGGKLSKARRGELYFRAPAGYEWDAAISRFVLDPDESVQRAIRLVFERFRVDGSACGVARYLVQHGLELPRRRPESNDVIWGRATETRVLNILHNPIHAGAYVYGRTEERMGLSGGELRRRIQRRAPQPEWKVCLRDHHQGYITWEEFMENQQKLADNRTWRPDGRPRGAAREGAALLQGLALCGRCGRRMSTCYNSDHRRGVYQCRDDVLLHGACFGVSAWPIDEAVSALFLAAIQPPELELALAVARTAEQQGADVEQQWRLRLEHAQYEARLAQRRYMAVDPDNRVVARTLERNWEEKLRAIEEMEREREEVYRREKVELTEADRARILALSRDLPAVWHAPTTTAAERKNLLRMLVHEVTLTPVDVPTRQTRVEVLWQTGAMSEFSVPRPSGADARATSGDAVSLIREHFAAGARDAEIATELNQRNIQTGAQMDWTVQAVQRVRHDLGLLKESKSRRPANRRADGLYSIHGVAAEYDVSPGQVRRWIAKGWLEPVVGGGRGNHQWFQLNEATRARLQQHRAGQVACDGETPARST